MADRYGPYRSPSERFMKRYRVDEEVMPLMLTQEPASPDTETPVIRPREIQERFLAKMNQEIERNVGDITCSEVPADMMFQSCDTDAMFDDIPVEDLEEALAIGEVQTDPKPTTGQAGQDYIMHNINEQSDDRTQDGNAGTAGDNNDDVDGEDDDMFGDDLPMEFLEQISYGQDEAMPSPDSSSKYKRYIVANVSGQTYIDDHGFQQREKILYLLEDQHHKPFNVRLRDEWMQTHVVVGDIVHIPLPPDATHFSNIIDNDHGYIILHPDHLISCTAVAESFFCLRKSILQQKVKSVSDYSEALVHGDIIHRVIQRAMQTQDFSIESLKKEMWDIIKHSLDQLFAIDQDEDTAMNILQHVIGSIKAFADTFIGSKPKPHAKPANDVGPDVASTLGCTAVAVSRVLDVEEHLWSPTYGLKGMIDASIEIKFAPNRQTFTIPLELKTGRASRFISHRAQTILYTLLMSDRYDIGVIAGALYYSKVNSFYLIPAARSDLKGLLIARNRLASALQNRENLPTMLKNLHSCQHCTENDACMLFHKAVEGGNAASSGLGGWFDAKTQHISETTAKFFRDWQALIDKEEDDIDYIRRDIWRQDSSLREKSGKCLHNMKLVSTVDVNIYRFQRSDEEPIMSHLAIGDPIIVSSVKGHINLGMGFVKHLDRRSITVSLTGPLRRAPERKSEFDLMNHQVFSTTPEKDMLYRIDQDELAGGMATMRRNLVTLVNRPEDGGDEKRRRLIVDLKKPAFDNSLSIPDGALDNLNPAQQHAMEKVFSAQDYTLILGMPGTGKTMTTAAIICALVRQNKSVLLTAYTHSALDNVLSKVHKSGIDVLRLGNPDRVMPSLRQCVPSNNVNLDSVAAIEQFYNSRKVVGTTCLGITHNLFQKRRFDYCIVDEASQITLPACIGPLRYADVFVLVGDQYQLPPVVRDEEARRSGFSKSLFSLLAEAHPESVAYLEYQYRMNKDIMSLSNILVYDSKLKCGTHAVARRMLKLPNIQQGLETFHEDGAHTDWRSHCWIADIIDPSRKVVFIDTDRIPAREERVMDVIQNDIEANLLCQLADALLMCGLDQKELAVISVYRSQLRLISQYLRNRPDVEIATIDKYQGRDKECVLISLVRSNAGAHTGDLLRDWRRINVALTRAKSKVVLIGSKSTLEASALFQSFLALIQSKRWIYELYPNAHKQHVIRQIPTPPQPERTVKVFSSPTHAILRKRPILKDVYNSM